VEKYDCSDETGEQSEPERLAKRIAAMKLARPTRHRNSSDELPRMIMNLVYGFRSFQRSSGAWSG
jgi:hypothetical protein